MSGVQIDRVSKSFSTRDGALPVVEDFSAVCTPGSFTALIGPSGCGKSTLLRMMQGLDQPDAGSVRSATAAPLGRVSTMFQQPSLLPWRTVHGNVAFGLELRRSRRRTPSAADRRSKADYLIELTGLSDFRNFYPAQLSGGMRQRVNLARALAVEPDVLLLDEPFSALDAMTRERLQVDVTRIVEAVATTTILVTHDLREAVFLADRVIVMSPRPGRITSVIDVPFARPRSAELQHSTEVAALVSDAWKLLEAKDVA